VHELSTPRKTCACWWKAIAIVRRNSPDGLAALTLPEYHHRLRPRTSTPIERAIQQEIKRRTNKVRVFPNEESLERLVSAVLVEIDNKWISAEKAYIKWENQHD
jgi:transposase-like protein